MAGRYSDPQKLEMLSGSLYYAYAPVTQTPITSIQIFHVTAVSASWKLQTCNISRLEAARLVNPGDTRGAGLGDGPPTGSMFWYNEPSASIANSTGSANTVHTMLHIGNLGCRFVRIEVDAGGPKSLPAPAGYISTASIAFHSKGE